MWWADLYPARTECQDNPKDFRICGDALIKCRKLGRVAMDQTTCNSDLLVPTGLIGSRDGPDLSKSNPCRGCTSYADGQCTLDNDKFEKWDYALKKGALDAALGMSLSGDP